MMVKCSRALVVLIVVASYLVCVACIVGRGLDSHRRNATRPPLSSSSSSTTSPSLWSSFASSPPPSKSSTDSNSKSTDHKNIGAPPPQPPIRPTEPERAERTQPRQTKKTAGRERAEQSHSKPMRPSAPPPFLKCPLAQLPHLEIELRRIMTVAVVFVFGSPIRLRRQVQIHTITIRL